MELQEQLDELRAQNNQQESERIHQQEAFASELFNEKVNHDAKLAHCF